jgi:hypothetical protein
LRRHQDAGVRRDLRLNNECCCTCL